MNPVRRDSGVCRAPTFSPVDALEWSFGTLSVDCVRSLRVNRQNFNDARSVRQYRPICSAILGLEDVLVGSCVYSAGILWIDCQRANRLAGVNFLPACPSVAALQDSPTTGTGIERRGC